MGLPAFINLKNYLTHTAVWEVSSVGTWGETAVSTSMSVKCLYYTGNIFHLLSQNSQGVARPVENVGLEHSALLYSTPGVQVGDHLCTITNQDGDVMVASARITRVEAFHGWRNGRGLILRQVTLAFN